MKVIDLNTVVLDTIPILNPSVISRETIDEGIVLVNCDTGRSLALNKTGKIIWSLIDGIKNTEDIIRGVSERFKEVPDSVTDDVNSLLSLLSEEGFIGYEIKH